MSSNKIANLFQRFLCLLISSKHLSSKEGRMAFRQQYCVITTYCIRTFLAEYICTYYCMLFINSLIDFTVMWRHYKKSNFPEIYCRSSWGQWLYCDSMAGARVIILRRTTANLGASLMKQFRCLQACWTWRGNKVLVLVFIHMQSISLFIVWKTL